MKRAFISLIAAVAAVFALSSCKDNSLKFYNLEIALDESSFGEDVPSPQTYVLTFTNTNTGEVLEFTTEGKSISAKDIPAGVYDIVASARLAANNFSYNYIGSAKGVVIDSDAALEAIRIQASKISALMLKEVFYCCSRTPANTTYLKDNFFEIYNNGNEPVYVDGLCIATSSNYNISTINFANEEGYMVGADGTPTTLRADEYLALNGVIWKIPGDGKTYLLNPGESFVIASYATDHTAEDKNPNSIDLSSADFETYCDNYGTNGQVDNKQVPNMILVNPHSAAITKQYMPSNHTAGFVFFRLDTPEDQIPIVGNYKLDTKTVSGKYPVIPRKDVLDGINWVKNETTAAYLPETIDAGKTWVSNTCVGESVLRKVDSENTSEDGHTLYLDTNNSTNDFEVSTTPTVRRNSKPASWRN